MKTAPQKLAVSLSGHSPVLVTFYCTKEEENRAPLVDLHLQFRDMNGLEEIHLTEAVQKKAVKQEPLLQIIIEDIVQEYFHHQRMSRKP